MGLLDGKVAVITGAGRGIGRTEALLLASEGASVVVNDVGAAVSGESSEERPAEEVVNEIKSAGGTAVPNFDDITSWEGGQRLIQLRSQKRRVLANTRSVEAFTDGGANVGQARVIVLACRNVVDLSQRDTRCLIGAANDRCIGARR